MAKNHCGPSSPEAMAGPNATNNPIIVNRPNVPKTVILRYIDKYRG